MVVRGAVDSQENVLRHGHRQHWVATVVDMFTDQVDPIYVLIWDTHFYLNKYNKYKFAVFKPSWNFNKKVWLRTEFGRKASSKLV